MSANEIRRQFTVLVPEGATPQEEQRLVDAAAEREAQRIADELIRKAGF